MQPPAGEFPRAQTDNQRIPQKRKYSIFLNMSKDDLELKYFWKGCLKREKNSWIQNEQRNYYMSVLYEIKIIDIKSTWVYNIRKGTGKRPGHKTPGFFM